MGSGNHQFLTFLLVFGSLFVSWLFRWLRERQVANRIKLDKARRIDDAIRTGRPGDAPNGASPSHPELEALARRRQAQLKVLRERQQGLSRSQPPQGQPVVLIGSGKTPARPTPRPGPPFVARGMGMPATPAIPATRRAATPPPPRRPGGPPAQSVPSQRGKAPARPTEVRRGQAAATPMRQTKGDRGAPDLRRRPAEPRRAVPAPEPVESPLLAPAPELAGALRPAIRFFGPGAKALTIADLRRAIVLRELVAPPVALRQPGSEQGLF